MITYRPIVLVCEDCDEDFDTLKDAVRTAGVAADLRRATTGDACLTLLRGNGGEPVHPAVVLLDLNTPGTDGREALKEIKENAALRHLPVVVLTTSANPRDLAFCYHAGAMLTTSNRFATPTTSRCSLMYSPTGSGQSPCQTRKEVGHDHALRDRNGPPHLAGGGRGR